MSRRLLTPVAVLTALLATPAAAAAQDRPPSLRAPAAILVEPSTRDVVVARRADDRRAIASTTKLMTALLTVERASLDDVMAAVDYDPAPAESVAGLRAGERLTVRDLLRALLLASANDAAETLAVRVAGSRSAFVRLMNQRARQLGLRNTRFSNPIGLDAPGNHSSAADLVKLALVLRTHRFVRETMDRPRAVLRSGDRRRVVLNRNTLVRRVPSVNGVKTGHTSRAGYVLVGSATRDGVTVLSAVLGAPSEAARDADTLALLRHGLRRYRSVRAVRRGQVLASATLAHRDGEQVALQADRTVRRIAKRGERVTVRVVEAPEELDGPLPRGARVGRAEIRHRGRVVARIGLVTADAVDEATFLQRLSEYLGKGSTMLLLAALALCSLYLVLLRRRAVRRARRQAGGAEIA